jgi:hypothetical protein
MPDDTTDTTTAEAASDGEEPVLGTTPDPAAELRLLGGALRWTNQLTIAGKQWLRDRLDYEIREGIGA